MSSKNNILNLERLRNFSEDYGSRTESIDSEAHTVDSSVSIHFFDNGYITDSSLKEADEKQCGRLKDIESFSSVDSDTSRCSTVISNTLHTNNNFQNNFYHSCEKSRKRELSTDGKKGRDTPTPTKFSKQIEDNSKTISDLFLSIELRNKPEAYSNINQ